MYDFLIIGAGIFGLSTAIELAKRKYKVGLLNPDSIPHHLAASTDISKIVRMEYGSDTEYFRMAEICLQRWEDWNDLFGEELYHETGFLLLCTNKLESPQHQYELASFEHLEKAGYSPEKLDAHEINRRFPAVNTSHYTQACFNTRAGYVESGRAIEKLAAYAHSLGVDIHESQTAEELIIEKGHLQSVKTREGNAFPCGHAIIAAGAHTPYLLPELQPYMRVTGHPVFWIKPQHSALFSYPNMSVFAADISNSGWYGFPLHPKNGVIKIGRHTEGIAIHPDHDDRRITDAEVESLRTFLKMAFPKIADSALVYTRRCLYTDTLDGHFWIDRHPEIKELSVCSGGSGHGMKMGPIVGEIAADRAEGQSNAFAKRYCWRHIMADMSKKEDARFMENRKNY